MRAVKLNKPQNYREPLLRSFDQGIAGRFIRLADCGGRPAHPHLTERSFRESAKQLLQSYSVSPDMIARVLERMAN